MQTNAKNSYVQMLQPHCAITKTSIVHLLWCFHLCCLIRPLKIVWQCTDCAFDWKLPLALLHLLGRESLHCYQFMDFGDIT